MEKDLISVVLLTYRNIFGLYPTLDSIFQQDYPKIEIVISDDGSPNAAKELEEVRAYIECHKTPQIVNVVIHSMPVNVGTVKNLNNGIRLSTGEYIKQLDAEDTFNAPDVLSKYRRFLDESGCLVCIAKVRGVDDNGNYHYNLASCENDYDTLSRFTPDQMRDRLFARNCLPAPAFFYRRELFEQNGFFPEDIRLIEDYPYWIILSMNQVKFAFLDERLIDYRLSGVSSSGHYGKAFMKDMFLIYDHYIFPNDHRFGVLQPIYNQLKRGGLGAYQALADWDEMSVSRKMLAAAKYAPFLAYIRMNDLLHQG